MRDGGLINRWQFDDELVRADFQAIDASGVDYLEIGYRAWEKMFSSAEYGPWRFIHDDHVRRIVGSPTPQVKLGAMLDIGRVAPQDILPGEMSLTYGRRELYYVPLRGSKDEGAG